MVHALVTLVLIVIFRKMLRLTGIPHNSQKMHQTPASHENKAENLLILIVPECVCRDIVRCLPPGGVVKWSETPSGALIAVAGHWHACGVATLIIKHILMDRCWNYYVSSPTQGAEMRYHTLLKKFNHGLGTVIFHDLLQKRDLLWYPYTYLYLKACRRNSYLLSRKTSNLLTFQLINSN